MAGESHISGGSWGTIKGRRRELRCSPIKKQSFCNSGSSDVADSCYQAPRFSTPLYDPLRFCTLDGSAGADPRIGSSWRRADQLTGNDLSYGKAIHAVQRVNMCVRWNAY